MRRIVWKFGLMAGAVLSVMMVVTMPLLERIGSGVAMLIGYTTMVIAFLMVYAGVGRYRDELPHGVIRFGRAFATGLLITLVSCACYVVTWEVIYHQFMPDFADRYAARELATARASGASPGELAEKARQMEEFRVMYRNPLYNVAMTFAEPLPVGLIFTRVAAGILSRRPREDDGIGVPVKA